MRAFILATGRHVVDEGPAEIDHALNWRLYDIFTHKPLERRNVVSVRKPKRERMLARGKAIEANEWIFSASRRC